MLDDFRNEFSFIDYVEYPNLKIWNASKVAGPRKHQKSEDCICVFLNFQKLGEFKDRKLAIHLINKLLNESPVDLLEYKNTLL